MKCIKTGFVIYINSMNKFTRMDLFFDGIDLYSNKNEFHNGRPSDFGIKCDIECDNIHWDGNKYYKIINPVIHQCLIDYVDEMKFKGFYEDKFLAVYSDGAS